MYFGIMYILIVIGISIPSIVYFIPSDYQYIVPNEFRFLAWMVGMLVIFMGVVVVWTRAQKTGANHLINPGRPGNVLWFFFYADGECRILPSKRAGEGQLYNPELDSQIIDVKTYSLCDHKIRIVPEVVGHAVDLDYVGYVDVVQNKYGFDNLRQARSGAFNFLKRKKEIIDREHFVTGDEYESIEEKVDGLQRKPELLSTKSKFKKPTGRRGTRL